MAKDKFYALLNAADVLLDPFPWGGGVTALEGFASGGVFVTLPHKQHVVKLAKGMYELMGFRTGDKYGVISGSLKDYVDTVVSLGRNGGENELRDSVVAKIKANIDTLFLEER